MQYQKALGLRRTAVALSVVFNLVIAFIIVSPCHASDPDENMYYVMGQKYMEKSDFDMAALAFEKAVKLEPDSPEAHNALGEAYVQLLRFDDAMAEFNKAIELKPDYTRAKANQRRNTMAVGRYEPMKGSRLNRWHKLAILGGVVAAIVVVAAVIVSSTD